MAVHPATAQPPLPPFLRIAHGAGNNRRLLHKAVESGVEFVEADVRPLGDRLIVARHERRAGPLPVLYEKWYLKPDIRPVRLEEIAEAARGRVRVCADMKSRQPGFTDRVIAALRKGGAFDDAVLSGHHWYDLADAKRGTGIAVFPSVPDGPALSRFWEFADRDGDCIDGVAIAHWLLDEEIAAAMRERGLRMLAWTVDSFDRADELVDLGVDGLISNHIALLHHAAARVAATTTAPTGIGTRPSDG